MTSPDIALREKRHAIVMEHMTAENAYEFERCIGAFGHPRYEIMPTGEVWDGHDGVNTLLQENITAFPDFHFDPQTIYDSDAGIVVEGRFAGTHLGTWRGLPATGRKVDFPLAIIFLFDGDQMICERTYFDIGTVLQQLGVAHHPNSLGGRLTTMMNHPINIAAAYLRKLVPR